jgi:hypothetical protein
MVDIEALVSVILPKIAERSAAKLLDQRPFARKARFRTDETRDSLQHHFRMIERWASEISFRELAGPKSLLSTFVDLDLHLGGVGVDGETNRYPKVKVSDLVDVPANVVILGDPGSGKSTSLKRIALSLLATRGIRGSVPILIQLRDFRKSDSLVETLLRTLGLSLEFDEDMKNEDKQEFQRRLLIHYLDKVGFVMLIDGLDEINPVARDRVVGELRYLVLHTRATRLFLSCRTAEFVYNLENTRVLSLEPLNDDQIREFTDKWLGREESEEFLTKIRATPYSGSEVRPLTLAHLCAIYERLGTVPEKPRTIYKKIVRLLIEEWDQQRSIKRQSRYSEFTVDRKEDFLEALAYYVTTHLEAVRFSHSNLESVYKIIHSAFKLPASDAGKVMREIESHTGLVVEVAFESYEFTHKSIQEYLTAAYLVKLPHIPSSILHKIPNEAALAVGLSSDPTAHLIVMIGITLSSTHGRIFRFAEPFIRRLQVERIDLTHSRALGLAIVALYSGTYYPSPEDLRAEGLTSDPVISPAKSLEHSKNVFGDFLADRTIADSIAGALHGCRGESVGNNRIRVRPDGSFIPSSLRNIRGVIIDKEMLAFLSKYYKITLERNYLRREEILSFTPPPPSDLSAR